MVFLDRSTIHRPASKLKLASTCETVGILTSSRVFSAAMTETTKVPGFAIEEDSALAYSHVQELAQIQSEIQALRLAIPALMSPLLRGSNGETPGTTTTPANKSDHKLLDTGAEFREQAIKVQGDVVALVKNLERICDTLEAAEKVRNDDYSDMDDLHAIQKDLQRTNVVKEMDLPSRPMVQLDGRNQSEEQPLAPAIPTGGDFVFANDKTSLENGHDANASSLSQMEHNLGEFKHGRGPATGLDMQGLEDFQNGAFDDFGLDAYEQDWTNFSTS